MQYKSSKIRIEPNDKQLTLFAKHAGCARYAYNWGLEVCEKEYKENRKILSPIEMHKLFVAEEKSQHEWLYEVSKCATQQALRNLGAGYKNFHTFQGKNGYKKLKDTGRKDKDGNAIKFLEGLPQKKKKKKSRDSFYLERDGISTFPIKEFKIKLPKIGWVRLSENIPADTKIKNCVISRHADQWFVSFRQEFEPTKHNKTNTTGVDLGIKKYATLANGDTFDTPEKFKQHQKKMKHIQRSLSRKYEAYKPKNSAHHKARKEDPDFNGENLPMSKNFKKNKNKLARQHKKIGDSRKDFIHKFTTYLAKNHGRVVIEDLAVKNMLKNHNLAGAIANGSFYEFRRQLEYKCAWYGCELIIADRFFPSSKMCSCCHEINEELTLKDRKWTCKSCGTTHDRDVNAAKNLAEYPDRYPNGYYAASSVVKARGVGRCRDKIPVTHEILETERSRK